MTTLFLIRHGENDFLKKNKLPGNLPGIHLNERGRGQAEEIAKSLGSLPIKGIYASPLERAIETGEPLAHKLGLTIQIRPSLRDVDVGEWAGRSLKVLSRLKDWKLVQSTPSRFQFPGGETFAQAQQRVAETLDQIAAAHEKEMVGVFFHADPIRLAVAYYLGLPLDNFQRLIIHSGSVTMLEVGKSTSRLLASNLIPPFSFPKR